MFRVRRRCGLLLPLLRQLVIVSVSRLYLGHVAWLTYWCKVEFPREQFPRSILVVNVTRMSLICHEEIGHSDMSDEDATRMLATCPQQLCLSVSWNLENDTTHGHRSRPSADQSGGKLNGEVARHARYARIAGFYENATRKLLP